MDALRQNDFEAYKELLRQTHGPQTDEDRFKGESARGSLVAGLHVCIYHAPCLACSVLLARLSFAHSLRKCSNCWCYDSVVV